MQLLGFVLLALAAFLGFILTILVYRTFKVRPPSNRSTKVAAASVTLLYIACIGSEIAAWPEMTLWTTGVIGASVICVIVAAFIGMSRASNEQD